MEKKGFTLIEVLATVTIIAILSVIAIAAVNSIITHQRERTATLAEQNINEASIYFFQNRKATYIEPCKDLDDGNYSVITQELVEAFNNDKRSEWDLAGITGELDRLKHEDITIKSYAQYAC